MFAKVILLKKLTKHNFFYLTNLFNLFKKKGGSSLANKESRFSTKKDEVPGPGAYVIPNKENRLNTGSLKVYFP
jgi:hypothetical protein